MTNFNVKPYVLETRLSTAQDFMGLSDGFKKAFMDKNKKDEKMILPISGYSGHRRGYHCQNYFGKSFRESTI